MVTLVTDNEDTFELQVNKRIMAFPPRPPTINSSEYTQVCLQAPETLVGTHEIDDVDDD
jgi:hypothetical protein